MKTLLLDNGTNTTVCMGGNKSSAGSMQNGGETPWMSLPKEKKKLLTHLEMTVPVELTIKFTNSLHGQ